MFDKDPGDNGCPGFYSVPVVNTQPWKADNTSIRILNHRLGKPAHAIEFQVREEIAQFL